MRNGGPRRTRGDTVPDAAEDGSRCAHIRALCRIAPLAPFINRARIRLDGSRIHLDFPVDFGRELFLEMGLKDYLEEYLSNSLGRPITVAVGRCNPEDAPEPAEMCHIALQTEKDAAPPAPAPKAAPAKKDKPEKVKTPLIHGRAITGEPIPIRSINDMTGPCVIAGGDGRRLFRHQEGDPRRKKSVISFGVTDLRPPSCARRSLGGQAPEIVKQLKRRKPSRWPARRLTIAMRASVHQRQRYRGDQGCTAHGRGGESA